MRSRNLLLAAVVTAVLAAPVLAQFPNVELNSVFPPGAKQGTEVEVTVTGTNLDDLTRLMFTHEGLTAEPVMQDDEFLGTIPTPNKFKVKVGANVEPGVYECRVAGRFGTSNPRAFAVGNMDEMMDDGSNKSMDKAKEITPGHIINGIVDAATVDYYKLTMKAGERVVVDCLAERVDSRMNPTLVMYDSNGTEILRNRDALGQDSVLDFTAEADGDYIVGVYDFLYGGGADHFYRLKVHSGPHIDFVFPPAGVPGSNDKYTVFGRNLPGGKPTAGMSMDGSPLESVSVNIAIPAAEEVDKQPLGVFLPTNSVFTDGMEYRLEGSNPVRIGLASAPVVLEAEPNNQPDQSQKITVPCEFVGQFYPTRDDDYVQFDATAGEVYWLEVISHRLGRDVDPIMMVQKVTKNAEGVEAVATVATIDDPSTRNAAIGTDFDTSTDDPSYKLTVAADATYRVVVRDLFGSSGDDPRKVYRLVISKESPDFRLVATPKPLKVPNANYVVAWSPVLRKGGTTSVTVKVERLHGFDGEVQLTAEGLPEGVTCEGAVLGGPTSSAALIFTAADNVKAWQGPIRVVGKSTIDGKEVSRAARSAAVVWGTTNRTQIPGQFRVARTINLSVLDNEEAPAFVKIGDGGVIETARGAKLELPVKVTRRGEFKGDLNLAPLDVPNEFKPKNVAVKGDTTDGKLEVALVNNNTKAGAYTFYLQSDVKFKAVRNPEAIAKAEADQKKLDEIVKQINEEVKKATDGQQAATKAATDAAAELAKDKENADLQKKAQEATDAKTAAEAALKELQAKAKRAADRKKKADTDLANVKKANAAKDITVPVITTPIQLRVADSPFSIDAKTVTVKAGEKAELGVSLQKLFGFDEQVAVSVKMSGGSGVSVKNGNVAKGQADGKLEITATANATAGEQKATLTATAKFNNVTVTSTHEVVIKVEAAG